LCQSKPQGKPQGKPCPWSHHHIPASCASYPEILTITAEEALRYILDLRERERILDEDMDAFIRLDYT
jgi:hypothetical protein